MLLVAKKWQKMMDLAFTIQLHDKCFPIQHPTGSHLWDEEVHDACSHCRVEGGGEECEEPAGGIGSGVHPLCLEVFPQAVEMVLQQGLQLVNAQAELSHRRFEQFTQAVTHEKGFECEITSSLVIIRKIFWYNT